MDWSQFYLGGRYPWCNDACQIRWQSIEGSWVVAGSKFSISHWLCWSSLQLSHYRVSVILTKFGMWVVLPDVFLEFQTRSINSAPVGCPDKAYRLCNSLLQPHKPWCYKYRRSSSSMWLSLRLISSQLLTAVHLIVCLCTGEWSRLERLCVGWIHTQPRAPSLIN